jgi:hypothetical protein
MTDRPNLTDEELREAYDILGNAIEEPWTDEQRQHFDAVVAEKRSYRGQMGYIYFIQGQATKLIKIGFAKDVKRRVKTLQTGSPDKLVILHSFAASRWNEKEIHFELGQHKSHGEWFFPHQQVFDFINAKKWEESQSE